MRLEYTLTPKSRVSAGRRGIVQNTRPVYEVIPGTVVRGALGTTWWSSPLGRYTGADSQGTFDSLFVDHMTVFGAVPETAGLSAELRGLSWVACKYPGDACSDEWYDSALDIMEDRTARSTCPACNRALERGKGWTLPDLPGELPWMVSTTRTELQEGVAKDENLFTRQALKREIILRGHIQLDEDTNQAAVDWLLTDKDISVGGQRSTLGRCRWHCEKAAEPAPPELRELILRLRSPAILLDTYGAPSLDFEGSIQAAAAQTPPLNLLRVWKRPVVVSGWHGIAGLPKPEEWAVEAGSTAAIRGATPDGIRGLLGGIGIRRNEGFGEVELLTVEQARSRAGTARDSAERQGGKELPTTTPSSRVQPRTEGTAAVADESLTARETVNAHMADFIHSLPREAIRPTLRGLLALARTVRERLEAGAAGAEVATVVEASWSHPWARTLSGPQRNHVLVMMAAPADVLAQLITRLDRVTKGS